MFKEYSSYKKIRETLKGIYPMVIWLGLSSVIAAFLLILMTATNGNMSEEAIINLEKQNALILQLAGYFIILPIMFLIMYFRVKNAREESAYVSYGGVAPLKYVLIIFFATFAMFAGNELVSAIEIVLPSSLQHSYDGVAETIFNSPFWIQLIAAGIIGPLVEEIVFRFCLYNSLKRFSGKIVAALVTSLMFGIVHGNLSQGLYAFILSLVFIYVYETYKSFFAPVLAHISANTIGVLVSNLAGNKSAINTEYVSKAYLLIYIIGFVVFACFAVGTGAIINHVVKPKAKSE